MSAAVHNCVIKPAWYINAVTLRCDITYLLIQKFVVDNHHHHHQTERQTVTDRQTDRQTDSDRETDRETDRHRDRQWQTDRHRQTDRRWQTDRRRERQTDRETDSDIIIIIIGFSVYLHNSPRETLHSSIIRACRKQKSFELSFKTGSVSDWLNMIR